MADLTPRSRLTDRFRSALQGMLQERGGADEEARPGPVIALCLLASTLLWFSFSMRGSYQRMLEIPLQVVNLEDDEALVSRPPATARVQVEGEGIQLLRLYYNPPTIPLDASQEDFDLTTAASEAITGVRIETIIPRSVILQKDRRISRRVPVEPRVSVVPLPGHHVIGTPRIRPDSVTITGGQSVVSGLQRWPTRRLQVQPEGDTVSVSVTFSDSLANLLSLDAQSVLFGASVRQFTEGERFVDIRVLGGPAGQVIHFDPPTVKVIYQVALDQYDQALLAEDFYAEVSYDAIRRDTTGRTVPGVHYPAGIEFREYRLDPPALGYYFEVLFD